MMPTQHPPVPPAAREETRARPQKKMKNRKKMMWSSNRCPHHKQGEAEVLREQAEDE